MFPFLALLDDTQDMINLVKISTENTKPKTEPTAMNVVPDGRVSIWISGFEAVGTIGVNVTV